MTIYYGVRTVLPGDRAITSLSYAIYRHIRASTFTALVFFRRERNQRISIGKLRALSNTNRDSESGVPGQFRSMRLQWEELACACQSRGARAQPEKTIFRAVFQYSGVSRGIRVRYSTIRAMQFSDELHRVHTVASRDFMQPADGARVARGTARGFRETCLSPVTDDPRQT